MTNYYEKYIKYKTKYINLKNLKNEIENKILDTNQQGGNIKKSYSKFILDDNINNKYPIIDKEVNVFGYEISSYNSKHKNMSINSIGCFY